MSEQNQKPRSVTGVSVLCVILTLVLTVCLLVCVAVREHVIRTEFPKAASALQLDKVNVSHRSLARVIADDYIQDSSIGEEQMKTVLRDGSFHFLLGDKVFEYNEWLASGGEGAFPMVTEQECVTALKNNYGLLYRETGFQMGTEAQMRSTLEVPLSDLNTKISKTLEKGVLASVLKACIAGWFWIVPSVLLLAVLIWLIVAYVRSRRSAGTAIRMFSITGSIPCILLLVWGLVCVPALNATAYPDAAAQMRGTWITIGGIGTLGCIVLFGIGMIWKLAAAPSRKYESMEAASEPQPDFIPEPEFIPDPEEAPEEEADPGEEQKVIRRYCRFCGGELVNTDAKFCYKCGKPQEKPKSDE